VVKVTEDKRLLITQWAQDAATTTKYYKLFIDSLIAMQLIFTLVLLFL
jgi:hypothetical protein